MRPVHDFVSLMRRSLAAVSCVAIVVLAACGRAPEPAGKSAAPATASRAVEAPLPKPPQAKYQRDLYGKLEDCVADWAFAGKCAPVGNDAPERARGAVFMGPIYSNALRFEAQIATRREAFDQGYVQQVDENPSNRALAAAEVRS